MPSAKSPATTSLKEYIKAGFGMTLGSVAVFMICIFLAMCFFIPGFVLLNLEQKRPKEKQRTWMKVVAFILMGIGCIVGLGFGFGPMLGELVSEL